MAFEEIVNQRSKSIHSQEVYGHRGYYLGLDRVGLIGAVWGNLHITVERSRERKTIQTNGVSSTMKNALITLQCPRSLRKVIIYFDGSLDVGIMVDNSVPRGHRPYNLFDKSGKINYLIPQSTVLRLPRKIIILLIENI